MLYSGAALAQQWLNDHLGLIRYERQICDPRLPWQPAHSSIPLYSTSDIRAELWVGPSRSKHYRLPAKYCILGGNRYNATYHAQRERNWITAMI